MRAWHAVFVFFVACGAPAPSTSAFIALDRDFQGYTTWESFELDGGTIDEVHLAGTRRIFLNERPPEGATEWPVGTILVKELSFTTFAMVKRGPGYNTRGAQGWEWFELFNDTPTTVSIKWRGLGPPLGETYSKTGQTCNDCHGAYVENDSVLTAGFRL